MYLYSKEIERSTGTTKKQPLLFIGACFEQKHKKKHKNIMCTFILKRFKDQISMERDQLVMHVSQLSWEFTLGIICFVHSPRHFSSFNPQFNWDTHSSLHPTNKIAYFHAATNAKRLVKVYRMKYFTQFSRLPWESNLKLQHLVRPDFSKLLLNSGVFV